MRRRRIIVLFAVAAMLALLCIRIGYLYHEVSQSLAGSDGLSPTIFYGRPLMVQTGDHLDSIHFTERLDRLSYKKVASKPSTAGTFFKERDHLWIFLRDKGLDTYFHKANPVDIQLRDNRILSITSFAGRKLDSIALEAEEIGRVAGIRMESRSPVGLDAVSPHLQQAVVACEDERFYSHFGIDAIGIGRALFNNLKEQRFAEGGSTLTQQLAKNFFLSPEKTVARKFREAELALVLELRYSKKQILEMYLNKIYWGQSGVQSIYGAEEAANFYFSKKARNLSLEESALLAGIIHAPNRYNIVRHPSMARDRRDKVLAKMTDLGMIRKDEFLRASGTAVHINPGAPPSSLSSYFMDYIQRITKDELGTEKFYRTGYRYYTTLDSFHQAAAEEAVIRGLADIERKAIPAREPLQVALIAVDPKTGWLTAMVGGRNYTQTRFNRAVDAHRQPGSAFKPFVLVAALSQSLQKSGKWTLSTQLSGEPISLPTPEGMWTPSNFENKAYGNLTLRRTIEDSVNTATVRLANDVGFQDLLMTARRAGIKSPLLPVPSMALGSFEVTPIELAYAYATIASGGIQTEPFALFSITTADGNKIISRDLKREQVFDPRVAYLASYALRGVLERGTAKEAKALGINFPVSGKTGTTNGNRDSWFVSYTPDIVCAVWVGYDSGADTGLTGAAGALRINARFLQAFYSKSKPHPAAVPEGIETAVIDPVSGYLATASCPETFQEAYLLGTKPAELCPDHPDNPLINAIRKKARSIGEFLKDLFK